MSDDSFITRNSARLMRLLLRRNRLARMRRYLRFRKARRMIDLAQAEMAAGKVVVSTRPVYLNLDTGPVCNLKCRFCCTANGVGTLKREFLQPETFNAILRHIPFDALYEANLFNWGEPLLNPHLCAYIRPFAQKGVRTVIHTNFSAQEYDTEFMETLIRSGISEITASVDGAGQETYEKYRVGGNFERVIGNIRRLAQTKARLQSDTPHIVYKMLLNRFNQHERDAAHALAESLGVAFCVQQHIGTPDAQTRAEWTADDDYAAHGDRPVSGMDNGANKAVITECRQMWDTLVVNADGAVFPCCLVCTPASAVGNLATQPFEEIWNGERMAALRRYALEKHAPPPDFPNSCVGCPFRNCDYKENILA